MDALNAHHWGYLAPIQPGRKVYSALPIMINQHPGSKTVLEAYRAHVAERAQLNIPAKPLNAEQVAALIELLKNPPEGEAAFLLDLLANRVPPGVDEAAYVKAGFLSAIAKGELACALIPREDAVALLGNMHGGYNIETLVGLLSDPDLDTQAAEQLKHTLLMFEAFHDVADLAKSGNEHAKAVMESWAAGEWFTRRDAVAESIKMVVFKVTGETNTDDLSPRPMRGRDPISRCMQTRCTK